MKTRTICTAILMAFAFMTFNLYSQDKEIKIDQGIQNFSKYMGTWHSNMKSTSNGKSETVDYTVVYSPIADGHGVYMEETAKSPSMGTYKCSNLVGYDPYGKKLHWYSVDNMGTAHDHTFTWVTPDHFRLTHNSLRDGKKYTEDIDCKYKNEKTCDLVFIVTLDGKEIEKSTGTFEKVSK
jgi:hypothetical protein